MKVFWTILFLAAITWAAPVFATYCKVDTAEDKTTCTYKADRIRKNTQITISYTQQGWNMMIVVFLDDFAMIAGDAKVEIKDGEAHTLRYVSTRRDITRGKMMEAALYMVDESVLRELGRAKGKVHFYLANTDAKEDVDIKVAANNFEDIDAYIAETKTVLASLFKEQ